MGLIGFRVIARLNIILDTYDLGMNAILCYHIHLKHPTMCAAMQYSIIMIIKYR